MKKDIGDMELTLQKAEQDKQSKDNQIKTLNDEMARQDEAIGEWRQRAWGQRAGHRGLPRGWRVEAVGPG